MPTTHTVNLGLVTAYGIAKAKGYTGTYEEFCTILYNATLAVDYIRETNQTVANNAAQVAQDKLAVANDKTTVADLKNTVVTAAGQVAQDKVDVAANANAAQSAKDEAVAVKTWITSNTQVSTFSINPANGHLEEQRVGANLFTFSIDASGHLVVADQNDSSQTADLGIVSAYAAALDAGYAGSYQAFQADLLRLLLNTRTTHSVESTTTAAVEVKSGHVYNIAARNANGLTITLPDKTAILAAGLTCEVTARVKFVLTTNVTFTPGTGETVEYAGGTAPTIRVGDVYEFRILWNELSEKWTVVWTLLVRI